MTYESWKNFYNRETREVMDDWTNQLTPYLKDCDITCTITFRRHYVPKENSRKKNCSIFSASGHCKGEQCPVDIAIMVENKPKSKRQPIVFTVVVFNDPNHDANKEKIRRPVTGAKRIALGMFLLFS